jgi:hypothetical protein
MAKLKLVPASAIGVLRFNYLEGTARGAGLPPLYDLHIQMPPAAPVKRWRTPPPIDVLKPAALAVAKACQPADPPTAAEWKSALEAQLGKTVTVRTASKAMLDFAPHLKRQRGQKPNRRS